VKPLKNITPKDNGFPAHAGSSYNQGYYTIMPWQEGGREAGIDKGEAEERCDSGPAGMTGKQEFPLRMAEREMSWHAAVCRAALFAMGAAGSGY